MVTRKTRTRTGILLAGIYVILALFHILWAFTGPPTSVQILPTIPGEPEIIPARDGGVWVNSLIVAGALFMAALVVLANADLVLAGFSSRLSRIAGWVLGGVFIIRAIGEFRLVGFFKSIRETGFGFWDTWLYSPLCLVLGVGVLWLVATRKSNAS